jgi:hypothetical protein
MFGCPDWVRVVANTALKALPGHEIGSNTWIGSFSRASLGATKIENVLSATTQREVVREGEIPIALSGKAGGHLPLSLTSSFSYHQKKTQRWQGCRSTHIVNSLYSRTVPLPSSGGARLLGLRHRTDIDVCNEGRGCSLSSLTPTHFHLL